MKRSKAVTPQEMDKYWKHLSLYYVTEESDDADNPNGIVDSLGDQKVCTSVIAIAVH